MNIDNFIRQVKTKLDKFKIDLLKEKNELDKLSSKLIEFDNNLASLNLDNIQEILELLENKDEAREDIKFLNSYKLFITFLNNPQIENDGIKKTLLDKYNSLREKFKIRQIELINKQKSSIKKLQDLVFDYTKLKGYLENINNEYNLDEINEFMNLCELIEMNLTERLELITYIGKINLKLFKEKKQVDSVITKENVDDIIEKTVKNEEEIAKKLEIEDDKVIKVLDDEELKKKKEEDKLFKEKDLIIQELKTSINDILKSHEDILTYYYDFNAGKDMSKSVISKKDYTMSSVIIPNLLEFKNCLNLDYDLSTIDEYIELLKTLLEEYRECLDKYFPSKEKEDTPNLVNHPQNTANIILFSKNNDEFQVDIDLTRDDEDKKYLKQNELLESVRKFTSSTYVDDIRIHSNIDLLYKNVKNKYKKRYDNDIRAFRLRSTGDCRTCYVIIDTCDENISKINKLYSNNNIKNTGRVILIFSVVWVDANHDNSYEEANNDLQDNLNYINYINEIFKNPETKPEVLKEIIDESMTKCSAILNKENSIKM